MEKRELTCCFTGHRQIVCDEEKLYLKLKTEIIKLIEKGVIYFGAGGALGFDTMAAKAVLELREEYPEIKLILILPCKNQTRGWRRQDVFVYKDILRRADKVVYTSEKYHAYCMFIRNCKMVLGSKYCICYLFKRHSGTDSTVRYAEQQKLEIIRLA